MNYISDFLGVAPLNAIYDNPRACSHCYLSDAKCAVPTKRHKKLLTFEVGLEIRPINGL